MCNLYKILRKPTLCNDVSGRSLAPAAPIALVVPAAELSAPNTPLEPRATFFYPAAFLPHCAPSLNLQSNLYLSDFDQVVRWPKKGKTDCLTLKGAL